MKSSVAGIAAVAGGGLTGRSRAELSRASVGGVTGPPHSCDHGPSE